MHLKNVALLILHKIVGFNHVGVAQAHTLAQYQPLVFLVRFLAKVVGIDIQLTAERQHARAHIFAQRMSRCLKLFDAIHGVICEHYFKRIQHAHRARGLLIQVLANRKLQHGDIDDAIAARGADHVAELAQCRRRVAASSQPRDSGHARIIPAFHHALLHKLPQLALAGDGVARVQPAELVLARPARHRQMFQQPVVQRAVVFKFQGAD